MANLAKQQLRASLSALRPASSEGLTEQLVELAQMFDVRTIASYSPTASEPDVSGFNHWAKSQGTLLLPRVLGEELEFAAGEMASGAFGLSEPLGEAIAISEIELIIVPALAADKRGYRLGKGKGFYDRLLPKLSAVSCAVVFDNELLDSLEVEPHDQPTAFEETPKKTIRVAS